MLISRLFFRPSSGFSGFPWWFSGEDSTCQYRRLRLDPWIEKIPLEKEMATHCSILAWRIHGQRNLEGYSSWVPKESDTTKQLTLYRIGRICPCAGKNKERGTKSGISGAVWGIRVGMI